MKQIIFYTLVLTFWVGLISCNGPSSIDFQGPAQPSESSNSSSEKNPSSESSQSQPPSSSKENEVSDIKVCVYYAMDKIQLDEFSCNCHHCHDGELSVTMNGTTLEDIFLLQNWTTVRPVALIKGGTRTVGGPHTHTKDYVEGYHKSDIPGQIFTGGKFDNNGQFTIKVDIFTQPEHCAAFDSVVNKCGVGTKRILDQVLYSVIGQLGDKYFSKSSKVLHIGEEDTIRKRDIKEELDTREFTFGNWCEIEVKE